jgi:hypothetical protein
MIPEPRKGGICNPKCPLYGLEHEWMCWMIESRPRPGAVNGWPRDFVPGPGCPQHRQEKEEGR